MDTELNLMIKDGREVYNLYSEVVIRVNANLVKLWTVTGPSLLISQYYSPSQVRLQ